MPPDRVGVIRQLQYDKTLVEDDDTGEYLIDLRDSRGLHKTSKFFGPTVTRIPMRVSRLIDTFQMARKYLRKTADTMPMTDFLFFCGNTDKLMGASQFSQLTGKSFEGLTGRRCTMKLLRAAFVTWLRSRRDVPAEVLESTAHAMKHGTFAGVSAHRLYTVCTVSNRYPSNSPRDGQVRRLRPRPA